MAPSPRSSTACGAFWGLLSLSEPVGRRRPRGEDGGWLRIYHLGFSDRDIPGRGAVHFSKFCRDQSAMSLPPASVSWWTLPPSLASITYSCLVPVRREVKTILRPSGEKAGDSFPPGPAVKSRVSSEPTSTTAIWKTPS